MRGTNFLLLMARIPPQVMLLVVLGLAIGASFLINDTMQKKERELKEARKAQIAPVSQVLVAANYIPAGSQLQPELFKLETIETSKIPSGALSSPNATFGMLARVPINQGEPVLSQFLAMPEKAKGFEAKIRPGFRAITFPVDSSTGVAGFLTPDCHVDILAQIGSGAEAQALPILSDVQVIAVGQTFQKASATQEAQQVSCVTVSVGPKDAGKLINAMTAGKLYCLMRNSSDPSPLAVTDVQRALSSAKPAESIPKTDFTSLLPVSPAVPPLPPPELPNDKAESAKLRNVDIWAGNKKDQLEFVEK